MTSTGGAGINHTDIMVGRSQDGYAAPHRSDAASALQANVGREMLTEKLVDVGVDHDIALLDTATRPITGSTTGIARFQTKTHLGVIDLINGQKPGEILLSRPLDQHIDEMAESLAQHYVNYRMKDVSVVLENTAPFAAASGSVQMAYINDPENQLVTVQDQLKILELVIRQSHSRQVKAKDKGEVRLDFDSLNVPGAPSSWKFCKSRPGKIFTTYGTLAVVVRAPPNKGDGATFAVSLAATWEFYGMTKQVQAETEYVIVPDTGLSGSHENDAIDIARQGYWRVKVDATGFPPIQAQEKLAIMFNQPISYLCHVEDEYRNVVEFYGLTAQATVYNSNHEWYISFPVESTRLDGLVGQLTRRMEFPPRTISGVVIQSFITNAIYQQGYEAIIARGMAQGISMLANKMTQLEFQMSKMSEELTRSRFQQLSLGDEDMDVDSDDEKMDTN